MDKHLHIICLDVPYPADYGGVFDLFYKIKSLHRAGIKIHLHCFEYGRKRQPELNNYCDSVQYYQRNSGITGLSLTLPYIVKSRNSPTLLENLLLDEHPILAEGIHCTYLLVDKRFDHRRIILRLHNVEYLYYRQLARTTNSIFKRLYYFVESKLLYRYEKKIAQKVAILAVSMSDVQIYRTEFGARSVDYLPIFIPYAEVISRDGLGTYCLYHGNLSVAENEKAASWLLKNVFNKADIPFVVAGRDPSPRLARAVSERSNCCLLANPSEEQLQDLIAKAQINVLPSFNSTGIKLKLLNALMNGRHCIVNEAAGAGLPVTGLCHVGHTAGEIKSLITELQHKVFSNEDIQRRKLLLKNHYDNFENTQKLIQWIW